VSPVRALALTLLCAGLAACATPPARDAAPEVEVPGAPAVPAAPALPEPPPGPDLSALRITVASVGDMMIGTDYPDNRLPDDDALGFFDGVAAVLRQADLAVGNLEGVLLDGGEPVKKCSNPSACWLFRSPTRYAGVYRDAGFDLLSLANNHARDFGEEGRDASMAALDAAGIGHSGREGTTSSIEVGGVRVGFVAFSGTRGANPMLNPEVATAMVAELAADHDVVIVSFHGGAEGIDALRLPFAEEEYYGEPRGDVVAFGRAMVDAGADLVFGHGPHVVRAMERYRGRIIAYSLGNFATYYGISVAGLKGVAPILVTRLDGNGEFIDGRVVSTRQVRPAGPTVDPDGEALALLARLSRQDFGNPGVRFEADGRVLPVERPVPKPHPVEPEEPQQPEEQPWQD
jgi:hypothetical protein